MKKFILLAAALLMSTTAFADSYTIVFNDNPTGEDGTAVIKPDVTADSIAAEGAEFIADVAIGTASTTTRAQATASSSATRPTPEISSSTSLPRVR